MHKVFAYIEGRTKDKFHGVISIPFQNGKIGNVKESNVLPAELGFKIWDVKEVFKRIEHWMSTGKFGTIEIPFHAGATGKPKECRVLKPEEL